MRTTVLALLTAALLVSCGSGASDPASTSATAGTPVPVDLAGLAPDLGLLGGYDLTIGPDGMTVELTPLRTATIGESFTVSGENFFRGPLCRDCLAVSSIHRDGNETVVTFAVRHPYAPGDIGLPPTGKNRLDLDVFDLALVLDEPTATAEVFPLLGARVRKLHVTREYSRDMTFRNLRTHGDALPFVPVVDDSSLGVSTNNRFAMGASASFDVRFELAPGESSEFDLFLAMGYGASATRLTRLTPTYHLPEFNRKNAWKVEVIPPPATPGATWDANDPTPHVVEVRVWDWQQGVPDDPTGSDPTKVVKPSDVRWVAIEIPALASSVVTSTTPSSGTGAPADPLVYFLNVPNDQLAPGGEYLGLVQVLDERTPIVGAVGGETDSLVHANDSLGLSWYDIPEFATYQTFTATVLAPAVPPIAGDISGCSTIVTGRPFQFTVNATGSNLTYNWDNGQNTPGVYDDGVSLTGMIDLTYATGGTFTVGCEVSNPAGSDIATPFTVRVLANAVFVDGDNGSDPGQNGSWDHPYDTIAEGFAAATNNANICLEPAATPYPMFTMQSNRTIIGFDRSCGLARPTVRVLGPATVGTNLTNSGIERIIFDYLVPAGAGSDILLFDIATNLTIRDCRFTGSSLRSDNTFLVLQNVDDSVIERNEWVNCTFTGAPGPSGRNQYMMRIREGIGVGVARLSRNIDVLHNEFHNIGYPSTASDAGTATRLKAMIVSGQHFDGGTGITTGTQLIKIRNNLFYDFFDNTTGATTNADHNDLEVLFLGGLDGLTFANNTFDDFDIYGGNPSQAGAMKGFYAGTWYGTAPVLKNNIWKSTIYYQGPMIFHWSAGFWKDGDGPYPMTNSVVYWGTPAPACGPCQVDSYLNRITAGTGSYTMTSLIDPNFNYTPGPNYYRPQHATVLTGGDDGSQMGAFGGPVGNWTPPSQYWP